MREKKVNKEQLVAMVRTMIKESLQNGEFKDMLPVEADTKTQLQEQGGKLSVDQLREMIRESITEVLNEETNTDPDVVKAQLQKIRFGLIDKYSADFTQAGFHENGIDLGDLDPHLIMMIGELLRKYNSSSRPAEYQKRLQGL